MGNYKQYEIVYKSYQGIKKAYCFAHSKKEARKIANDSNYLSDCKIIDIRVDY